MRFFIFFVLNVFFINKIFCQYHEHNIDSLIQVADSVVIKSHVDVYVKSKYIRNDSNSRLRYIPDYKRKLFVDNDLVDSFEVQRRKLITSEKKQLVTILTTYSSVEDFGGAMCFDPHQTIIFYLKGSREYIDLCFGCQQTSFSKGVWILDHTFSYNQWKRLLTFFQRLKIDYKIVRS